MKKYSSTLAIILLVIFLFSGCTNQYSNEYSKYYGDIRIDEKWSIIGELPIEKRKIRRTFGYRFVYNEGDTLIRIEYLEKGKIKRDPYILAVPIILFEYEGNSVIWIYQNKNGESITGKEGVYSMRVREDDDNQMSIINYDERGGETKDIYGVAIYQWEFDGDGNKVESRYYDSLNRLTEDKTGVAITRAKYDESGNIIESRFFGTDKLPKENNIGTAISRYERDEDGNILERRFYNREDLLTDNVAGIAILRYIYLDGKLIKGQLYNSNDEKIGERRYDQPSQDMEFIPYDEDPKPIGGYRAIQKSAKYPETARETGIEGLVIVRAYIDEKGIVRDMKIQKGFPNTGLDEAAMAAIGKTKFKPAKQRGKGVGVWISIPITFKLTKSKKDNE